MRIPYAQGFRIHYTVFGQKFVLLLAGSTKQGQSQYRAWDSAWHHMHQRDRKANQSGRYQAFLIPAD
jgi:putative component of toxin-antitoxin plasmid stabilization module